MKAIIFPNDPLVTYIKKGELIDRYYNPNNIFSDIDIISLSDFDVKPQEAQCLAGSANLRIYPVGRIALSKVLYPKFLLNRITKEIPVEEADIIIAYNSSLVGFLATKIGKMFNVPVLISLHSHPDKDIRAHLKWYQIKKRSFWSYSSHFLEKFTLDNASRIICAYNFITDYLISRGVTTDKIKVIYHRIDVEKFKVERGPIGTKANDKLRILCVGRVFARKNPMNIIMAIKNLDLKLTIIGDGILLPKLIRLTNKLNISDRVNFITTIPHNQIDRYYKESDIFACVNDYGGISKPVMEAMAASLPVVMSKPLWESTPEFIEDKAIIVENSALGFSQAFKYLLDNREEIQRLGSEAFSKIKNRDGALTEKEQAETIISVVRNYGKN